MGSMPAGAVPHLAGPSLEAAVLGIDVGMTATRASILSFKWAGSDDNVPPMSVSRPRKDEAAGLYNACDFPATAYPFQLEDPADQCLGYAASGRNAPFPLKMYCYFVRMRQFVRGGHAESVQKFRKDIAQLDDIWKRIQDRSPTYQDRVATHLKNIFIEHLKIVRGRSDEVAARAAQRITKLAVTVPPNWVKPMLDTYLDLLLAVWGNIGEENIEFIYESEAVGHWLLRLNAEDQRYEKANKLILADFGGHTLNTASFAIVRQSLGGKFAFFLYNDADCQHGGSELHTSWLKTRMEAQIAARSLVLTRDEKDYLFDECLQFYRSKCRSNIDGSSFFVAGKKTPRKDEQDVSFQIGSHLTAGIFKKAFKNPMLELFKHFRKSARLEGGTNVLLSGGSFRNQVVLNQAKDAIKKTKLTHVSWVDEPTNSGSAIVSQGAALAVVNALTITEYIRQGAFAIDYSKLAGEHLPVILDNTGSHPIIVDFSGRQGDSLWIKCAPLASLDDPRYVLRSNTYEFNYLDRHVKGKYKISMRHEKNESRGDRLILQMERLTPSKDPQPPSFDWPVFFDPGACVCFIDLDKAAVEENTGANSAVNVVSSKRQTRKRTSCRKAWESLQKEGGTPYWALPVEPEAGERLDAAGSAANNSPETQPASTPSRPTKTTGQLDEVSSVDRQAGRASDLAVTSPATADALLQESARSAVEPPAPLRKSPASGRPQGNALPFPPVSRFFHRMGTSTMSPEPTFLPDGLPRGDSPAAMVAEESWFSSDLVDEVLDSCMEGYIPADENTRSRGSSAGDPYQIPDSPRQMPPPPIPSRRQQEKAPAGQPPRAQLPVTRDAGVGSSTTTPAQPSRKRRAEAHMMRPSKRGALGKGLPRKQAEAGPSRSKTARPPLNPPTQAPEGPTMADMGG